MMDKMVEEFGPMPAATAGNQSANQSQTKRRATDPDAGRSVRPCRREAMQPEKILKEEDLPSTTTLLSCDVMNVKQGEVKIIVKQNNQIFLHNGSGNDVKMCAGMVLAGYGPGTWRKVNADGAFLPHEVEFKLMPESIVLHQGGLKTIKQLLEDELLKNPSIGISYHKKVDSAQPDQPTAWTLMQDERVGFVPKAINAEEQQEGVQAKQVSLAAAVPVSSWGGYVEVIFLTRWSAKGLLPVRPAVILVSDVVVPAKSALIFVQVMTCHEFLSEISRLFQSLGVGTGPCTNHGPCE